MRNTLFIIVGVSVGLSLGSMALHIVALIRIHDWRGQTGHILADIGWSIAMFPILKALSVQSHVEATGLTILFAMGVALVSLGMGFTAVDVNRSNRLLAVSAAKKVGLDAVEHVIADAESNEPTD